MSIFFLLKCYGQLFSTSILCRHFLPKEYWQKDARKMLVKLTTAGGCLTWPSTSTPPPPRQSSSSAPTS